MPDPISDSKRSSIIDALDSTNMSQEEIADEHDVSQATVSNIKRSKEIGEQRGRQEGKIDGIEEGLRAAKSFATEDQTEKPEDDEYWCSYCEAEGEGKVMIDYMQEECPNGHDLSSDW